VKSEILANRPNHYKHVSMDLFAVSYDDLTAECDINIIHEP